MSSEDGSLIVSLMPDYVSIDSTSYGMWKGDFKERVSEVLAAIAEHVKPRVEERVGLRYVNKEGYSKPHVTEKKNSPRPASKASS